MDDQGSKVQQLPAVAPVALPAQHGLAHLLHGVLGIIAEGLDMGIGGAGANQEVVRQRADPVNLQQLDIHTFLGIQRLGNFISDFFRC